MLSLNRTRIVLEMSIASVSEVDKNRKKGAEMKRIFTFPPRMADGGGDGEYSPHPILEKYIYVYKYIFKPHNTHIYKSYQ